MSPLLLLTKLAWAQTLGWTLLHFVWQGLLLGLLAWLGLALLRGASARARYGLACIALVAMVAAPLATFLWLQSQAPPMALLSLNVEATLPAGPAVPLGQRVKTMLDASLPWLLVAWSAGVLLLSTRFLGGWIRVQRLRRRGATPAPAEWHRVVSRLCRELQLSRTVRLLQSAAVEVPTALGWLRPVILLPACALTGLAPLQLEAILAHELAHIRRGDFLVNLLQSLVEVLLFYHPAVWWLSSRIRAERELCCDDVAAELCGDPRILDHALTDLEALRDPITASSSHLALAANGGSLMHRIRHLLQPALPITTGARAAALTVLAASLLGAAGVVLQEKEPAPKAESNARMKVLDGDRRIDIQMKGEVKLDPSAKEPVTVPGEGSFRIEEKKGGKARSYVVSKDKRTYTVDGQEKPLDAEGEAWVRGVVKDAAKAGSVDHAKIQAEVERALAEAGRTGAGARKMRVEVIRKGEGPETVIVRKGADGKDSAEKRLEIITEDVAPGTVVIRKKVDGKDVIERHVQVLKEAGDDETIIIREEGPGQGTVEKRVKVLKQGNAADTRTWVFLGADGKEHDVPMPAGHLPKLRLRHEARGDPQAEMAELQAQLKALQIRLDHLQKQLATVAKPPAVPKPPRPPKAPGVPKPPAAPLPPPPPPVPQAPPAPPAPPRH